MTEDLELYAACRIPVTLRYNNGRADETIYVNIGDTLSVPEPTSTVDGVHFSYWYNAEAGHAPYDLRTPVNEGFTLTAWWWYPGIDFEGGYTAEYTNIAALINHSTTLRGDVVVMESCSFSNRLTVSGKVRLILCDGITLNVARGIQVPEGSTLEIYGQSEGTGKLVVNETENYNAGIGSNRKENSGAIHIYGGTLDIHAGNYAAGIGGGHHGSGNVTIHGGKVAAFGGKAGAGLGGGYNGGGTLTLRGGSVKAVGDQEKAIKASTINFAWESYDSPLHLEAGAISGNIVFQKGFLLENSNETALPDNILGNVTLIPAMGMTFDANGGSGSMDYQAVARRSAFTLPACGFTPPAGKVFDCWQCSNGRTYTPGLTCYFLQGYSFKALWLNPQSLSFESVSEENPDGRLAKTWGDAPFTNAVTGAQTNVTWMSTDETVSTVDGNGEVTLTGTGEATIIATAGKDAGYSRASASYALTVEPLAVEHPAMTVNGSYTYTGSGIIPEVTVTIDGEAIPAQWVELSCENNIKVGTATVTATGAKGGRYSFSVAGEFPILPRPVTVSGIAAKNRHFNNDTDAELDCSDAVISALADGDEVTVKARGEFEDADFGQGKTVNITSITLEGRDMDNYVIAESGQQQTATATIYAPHTVVFADAEGNPLTDQAFAAQTVLNGYCAREPEITDNNRPVKEGWRFVGWQNNGVPFDFGRALDFDTTTTITLTPLFRMLYTVYAFPENTVTVSMDEDTVAPGDALTAKAPNIDPTNAERALIGFSIFYAFSSRPDADIVRIDYTQTTNGSNTEAVFPIPDLPTESTEGYIVVRAEYAVSSNLLDSMRNTQNQHIELRSGDDLAKLAKWVSAGHDLMGETVELMNDIDVAGTGFNGFPRGISFAGTFEGNGHTVSGISIRSDGNAGFFVKLTGKVENLTLAGTVFGRGSDSDGNYVGGIAAVVGMDYDTDGSPVSTGSILNCVSLLKVTNDDIGSYNRDHTGGVAGRNEGTVSGCKYLGMDGTDIYALNAVGNGEEVENCTALYAVQGYTDEYAGSVTVVSATGEGQIGEYFPSGCDVTLTLTGAPRDGWIQNGFKYSIFNEETYNYDDVNLTPVGGNTYLLTGIDRNVCVLPSYVYLPLSGLSQDSQNRYLITSRADLEAVAEAVADLDGCGGMSFLLTRDLENVGPFSGIAVGEGDQYIAFYGVFDGGGHTISGMKIISDSIYAVGFIGQLGGTLTNLTLKDCTVTGTADSAEVGMLTGNGYGRVTNCYVVGGQVSGTYAGAIMGSGYVEGRRNFYDSDVTVIMNGTTIPTGQCGTSQGDRIYDNAAMVSAYRVSFEDGLGNKLAPDQLVPGNGIAEKPVFEEMPQREHFTFTDTWQKDDGSEYTFSESDTESIIVENTTLYAVWEQDPTCTIVLTDGQEGGRDISYEAYLNQDNSVTVPDYVVRILSGLKPVSWSYAGTNYLPGNMIPVSESPEHEITLFMNTSPIDYDITAAAAENGSISVKESGQYGESISVNVTPDTGYTLEALTYKTEDGDPVEITIDQGVYSFEMPAEAVTVQAAFRAIDYTVTAEITGNGVLLVHGEEISNGETAIVHYGVYIFLLPDVGYLLDSFTVSAEDDRPVTVNETYFNMPACPVNVSCNFIESARISFEKGAEAASGIMDEVILAKHTAYDLPDCGFDPPEGQVFKAWSVKIGDAEAVEKQPGKGITVTADTIVTALWEDASGADDNQGVFILPQSLTVIEANAFEGITATRVEMSENVVSIGSCAFANCPNLREIHIPAGVTSVDDHALDGCGDVTVYGVTGTEAERFANAAGFSFVDPNAQLD